MKKLILILLLSFGCSLFVENAMAEFKTEQEIQMKEATIPSKTVRPRSLLPYMEAKVDYTTKTIEVKANYYLGTLEILVTDMSGRPVCRETLNSEVTPSVRMPMPDSGAYRISISGDEYLAEGDFLIL